MDLGLRQRDVAQLVGVREETIYEWEIGRYEPEMARWPTILAFLGHDPYGEPGSLREKLSAVQRRRGWGLRDLAEHLGVSVSTLQRWLAGGIPQNRRCRAALTNLLAEHGFTAAPRERGMPEPTPQ